MEKFIIKTNGSWDTLRKISDITDIQIIDPIDFEIAIMFNEHNIEFKEWILEEIELIEGVESIKSKEMCDKYSKIYHIQHYTNNLETLCGINGRLGLKVDFCEASKNVDKKLCSNCVKALKKINYSDAIDLRCSEIYKDEDEN